MAYAKRLRDQPNGPSVRKASGLRTLPDTACLTHNEKSLALAQAPTNANRTLPRRLPNAAYRPTEYLTQPEVELLIDAARKRGRNGAREEVAPEFCTGR